MMTQPRNVFTLLSLFIGSLAIAPSLDSQEIVQSARYQTLFSFDYNLEGGLPTGGVVEDSQGSLYGATSTGGGGAEDGVVFQLSKAFGGTWAEHVLYRFSGGNDGSTPGAGLTLNSTTGQLFGTAEYANGNATGVVFQLSPPASGSTAWTYEVLYRFSGLSDGGNPEGELLLLSNGALIGTTTLGGLYGLGVIFELEPPSTQGGDWTYTVLHDFYPPTDGANPFGLLAADPDGNIFGITQSIGPPGIVYEISPSAGGQAWTFHVIYTFSGAGTTSYTGLVRRASDGSLFGGNDFGGSANLGAIFQLTPPAESGDAWSEQTLYSFTGGLDGCNPSAVIVGIGGSVYGTTSGSACSQGSIFRISPPTGSDPSWTFTSLVADSNYPFGPLLVRKSGALLGTSYHGGATQQGTVYELSSLQ